MNFMGRRMRDVICRRWRTSRTIVALAAMWPVVQPPGPAASAEMARSREIVRYDNFEIDLIAEGRGPLIVMLPSRGRDSGRSRVAPAAATARSKASACRISRATSHMSSRARTQGRP
jgi:hypothetical protein